MSTFEDFLKVVLMHGHTQVKMVPRVREDGGIAFYACGQGGPVSSETFDGVVVEDGIINMEQPVEQVEPEAIAVEDLSEEELDDIALSEAGVADTGAAMDAEDEAAGE